MTEQLRADLELELGSALRSVDELRREVQSQLSEAIDSFADAYAAAVGSLPAIEPTIDVSDISTDIESAVADADAEVTPDADTSDVTASIESAVEDADAEVAVEADTADAAAAIESLADTEPVEVEVTADTSEAVSQVQELTEAVEAAAGSFGEFTGGADAVAAAGGVATGELAAMTAGLETLGDHIGVPGAALAVVAGTVGVFTAEAIDALGATQRFDATLGPFADNVERLENVQGLNRDLSDLALTLGSDDDKIRSTVARLFELGTASGVSGEKTSVFVQQMTALGARAVALNPQLGDVGDVTDAMTTALVRGGRFAAKFGLDLNQAEINSRALADTGKATAEELTFVEKAMAGAAIATEKYGGNLDEIITRGSENAITTQRRFRQAIVETFEALGQPLIAPTFEVMERAQPIVEALGTIFRDLALAALPAVIAALDAVEPPLRLFADVVEDLGPVLPIIIDALIIWKAVSLAQAAALGILALATKAVTINMAGFAATTEVATAAQVTGTGASLTMAGALGNAGLIAGTAAVAFLGTTAALHALFDRSDNIAPLLDEVSKKTENLADKTGGDLVKGYEAAVAAQVKLTSEWDNAGREGVRLSRAVAEQGAQFKVFKDIAQDDLTLAIRLAEQYRGNTAVYEKFQQILGPLIAKQADLNAANANAVGVINAHKEAVDRLAGSVSASVPGAGEVFSAFGDKVREAFGEKAIPSVQSFVDDLAGNVADIERWQNEVKFLIGQGLVGLAALVQQQGPKIGTALVDQINFVGPELAKAWDASLQVNSAKLNQMQADSEVLSKAVAEAIVSGMAPTPENIAKIMSDTKAKVEAAKNPTAHAAGDVGDASTFAFGAGVSGMPGQADSALHGVASVFDQSFSIVGSPANIAGLITGQQFGAGMVAGMESYVDRIRDEAARLVRQAEDAARDEARSQSPSRLFAELGQDLVAGLGMGMEQAVPDVVLDAEDVVRSAWAAMAAAPRPPDAVSLATGGVSNTSIDRSVVVHGGIHNYGPDPDSRASALVRVLRDYQFDR